VVYGGELRDWGVKAFKGKWSKAKLGRLLPAVSGLLQRLRPDVLALKKLHRSRSSANLRMLVSRIKRQARRMKLGLHQYSIDEIEACFAPGRRINRMRLAELIASEHPFLFPLLEEERRNRNAYHLATFEAVALALASFHRLDRD